MEIDITDYMQSVDHFYISGSRAELGDNAAQITWSNANAEAAEKPLIVTDDEFRVFRDWAKAFGAWSQEEIAAWTATECNALLMQYISGDVRELEALASDDDGEIDWAEAERLTQAGTIGGNIYPGTDGRIYFYMGH